MNHEKKINQGETTMLKRINSENKFVDITTDTIVLDAVPTVNSFNLVSSNGARLLIQVKYFYA